MRRLPVKHHSVDTHKTGVAVRHAIDEVQHAARPERRSLPNLISWAVAISAGAAVAWRSLAAARGPEISAAAAPDPETALSVARKDRQAAEKPEPHAARRRSPAQPTSDPSPRNRPAANPAESKSADKTESAEPREEEECPTNAQGASGLAKELWCRFQSDECLTRSQALAFIGVLSLGPVLLFALAALGFIIHDTAQVERFVHDLISQLLPGRQAAQAANNLIAQTHILESAHTLMKGKWWAVTIGVISLLWAAIGLFVGASDPMNAAWNVRETRGFVKLRLICLAVFAGAGILFLLSLIPSTLPSLAGKHNLPLIGALPQGSWWIELAAWLLAIAVDACMFTVIYRFLPNVRVKWKSALFGGAAAGLLWELFKKGFAVYLAHFASFDKLYGTLGGAVLLVTWIWYSCLLLLVGAILCRMYQEHTDEGGVRTNASGPGDGPQNEAAAAPRAA